MNVVELAPDDPAGRLRPHTPEWLEWRRGGIGGSDAPIITGDDPFKSQLELWLGKRGYLEAQDDGDDEPRYWGQLLEGAVIQRFERDTGLFVFDRQLCATHAVDSWRRATIDGIVYDNEHERAHGGQLGLFEGKTTSKTRDWADGVPTYVQIQVQHNLDVAELDHAWVAVLLTAPILHFKVFELERDESITGPLRELEWRFWQRVLEDRPPAATSNDLEALRQAYADSVAGVVELEGVPEISEPPQAVVDELVAARADKRAAERRVDAAEAILASWLRDREVGTLAGRPIIEWRRHERSYFDVDQLRAKHPKLAERFTVRRPYRQFTVPKVKQERNDVD